MTRTAWILGFLVVRAAQPAIAQDHHDDDDGVYTVEQVTERVYCLYGRGGNIGVVTTGDGVIVIDTQFADIAPGAIERIREITGEPIRYVVNTHVHGDHVGGNGVFQAHADVVAHERTYERLLEAREESGRPVRGDGLPQLTFRKEVRFRLGEVEIYAIHRGRGHTDTDVAVLVVGENVIHTGDLVFNEHIPYVDKSRGASTKGWREFLEHLYQFTDKDTRVIPGHGKVGDRQSMVRMHGFFGALRDSVARAHARGESKKRILARDFAAGAAFAEWDGQQRLPIAVEAVYTEIVGNGATLVVVNKSEDTVAFVDVETGDVRGMAETGPEPHEVAVSLDGRLAYVTNYGTGKPPGTRAWLSVVDVEKMAPLREIALVHPQSGEHLSLPHGITVTPDGARLLVTCEGVKALAVVSVADERVVAVHETGENVSHMVAVTPDGKKAYVANIGSGTTSAIDLLSGEVKTIFCDIGTEGIAVTPDGTAVWATNRGANTVSIIDVETDEVETSLETGKFPIRVVFTPGGERALITNALDGTVGVYDVETRALVRTVATGEMPVGVVVTPDGTRAYVANTRSDHLTVLDLESWSISATIRPGETPDGMAIAVR